MQGKQKNKTINLHILSVVWCSKQQVEIKSAVFPCLLWKCDFIWLSPWHEVTCTKHRGAWCCFQTQPTSLIIRTLEFNLHLTSTHVFLSALCRGNQEHCVCFLTPHALKPFSLMFWEIESVQRIIQMTHCLTGCLFSLSSISFPSCPPPPDIIFEDYCRLEDKNPGCGACRHFFLSPDLNKELWN